MTDTTIFPRRKIAPASPPPSLDSGIRDLLSQLRASSTRDTFDVLADATNSYFKAKARLTSSNLFTGRDVDNLITVWQILLDVGRTDPADLAGPRQSSGPKSGSEEGGEG